MRVSRISSPSMYTSRLTPTNCSLLFMFVVLKKSPDWIAPAGDSTDLHQILQYRVEATEHRDLVDLLGDLLQGLQLLEAQRGRVVFHHPGGVQQRAGRRGFLTAADHVRQRGLLGLHHLRQDGLHLTRQDDVLHADRVDLQAKAFHAALDVLRDHLVDQALVLEQLVQGAGAHRGAQAELELLVQVVHRLGLLAERGQHVGHAVACVQVHAQRDLVLGQDLLPRHFDHLQAQVHELDAHVAAEAPEGGQARLEHGVQLAVDVHHADVELRHLHTEHVRAGYLRLEAGRAQGYELRHQLRLDAEVGRDVDALECLLLVALEVQAPGIRRQHFGEHAVLVAQADLGRAELDHVELARHELRLGLHQELGQAVLEARLRQTELLHGQAAQRVEAQVLARAQDVDEVAAVEQQRAFVLLHVKLAEQHHWSSPFSLPSSVHLHRINPSRTAWSTAAAALCTSSLR